MYVSSLKGKIDMRLSGSVNCGRSLRVVPVRDFDKAVASAMERPPLPVIATMVLPPPAGTLTTGLFGLCSTAPPPGQARADWGAVAMAKWHTR